MCTIIDLVQENIDIKNLQPTQVQTLVEQESKTLTPNQSQWLDQHLVW